MNFSDATITFPMLGDGFSINPSNHITIFGKNIYWYGIIIAIGFILAVVYALKRCRQFGLTTDNIFDIIICAAPAGIVGARLYYCIFFDPASYFGPGKWLNIFKVWEGGLAIYGGIIFAVAAVIIYSRVKKVPLGPMLDIGGLGLLIGQAVGRWGNFMNREAFGAETDVFCRMGLTVPGHDTIYVHPTFLYESLWNVLGLIILHVVSKKWRKFDGQIFLMYIGWYGLGRFFIEGLRTDSLYLFGTDIRVSQLLALICFGAVCVILLKIVIDKHGKFPPLACERVAVNTEPVNEELASGAEDISVSSPEGKEAEETDKGKTPPPDKEE